MYEGIFQKIQTCMGISIYSDLSSWFIWLEQRNVTSYHLIYTSLDSKIPFSEYFIVPYLLWFIYVAGNAAAVSVHPAEEGIL